MRSKAETDAEIGVFPNLSANIDARGSLPSFLRNLNVALIRTWNLKHYLAREIYQPNVNVESEIQSVFCRLGPLQLQLRQQTVNWPHTVPFSAKLWLYASVYLKNRKS